MKNKPTFTLIIWEEWPENINYYLINNYDITKEYRILLENSQGKYINEDPFDEIVELRTICNMISEEHSWCDPVIDAKYNCLWKNYKIDSKEKIEGILINHIYRFGFCV